MSHLVPHYMLLQRGLSERNLAHMQHLNSHRNVAHAVLAGDFDAGAIKAEVYKEFSKQNLRILAETPEYPTHTFVTRSNLSNKLVKELRTAMKSLGKSEQGREILRSAHSSLVALVPAKDQDYEIMRNTLQSLDKAGVFAYR